MAVSGISSPSFPNSQAANQQNPRQLFMQLIKDIQSGNLDSAKQDYASLSQLQGNNTSNSNDPFSQAMDQIGKSLQSGDIGGAQQALATLQQQMEGKHQAHHHHHHGGGNPPPAPTIVAPADSSTTNSGSVDLTA